MLLNKWKESRKIEPAVPKRCQNTFILCMIRNCWLKRTIITRKVIMEKSRKRKSNVIKCKNQIQKTRK